MLATATRAAWAQRTQARYGPPVSPMLMCMCMCMVHVHVVNVHMHVHVHVHAHAAWSGLLLDMHAAAEVEDTDMRPHMLFLLHLYMHMHKCAPGMHVYTNASPLDRHARRTPRGMHACTRPCVHVHVRLRVHWPV